ncbi:3'-5' exonuclease [Nodosilinea sp. AN01ver1]|uniref:3'-5' exonuclease n=1 Tax=Nodosilinea sp. AN01ver1 TaxID=3423362 RepID=UPI003D3197FF
MFKSVGRQVCAFDLEWVPDPASGRRVYGLPQTMPDADVLDVMWARAGATADKPRPHLKTALCRVVAVTAVIREQQPDGGIHLRLTTLPRQLDQLMDEGELIATFLGYLGQHHPQLVGFNSQTADLPILLQRGLVAGISAADFCRRADKGWGSDYFSRHGDAHIDLKQTLSGWGIATPTLHELAAAMGIPGQVGTEPHDVVDWWVEGDLRSIVAQSQYDALSTYLVWLRAGRFAGFFNPEQYGEEEERVRAMLRDRIAQGDPHLTLYLDRWDSFTPQPADARVIPLAVAAEATDQAA